MCTVGEYDGGGGYETAAGGAGAGAEAGTRTSPPAISASRRDTSPASAGRSAGSLASRSSTRESNAAGSPARSEPGAGGVVVRCWASSSCISRAAKGRAPVNSSMSTQPRAYRSARPSTGTPFAPPVQRSGAMYGNEPMIMPVAVSSVPWPPPALAMPKSSTFVTPPSVTITLAGLTSRWTMPASWAAPSASATRAAHSRASASGGTPSSSTSARLRPCSSSITRKTALRPSRSVRPKSWTVAMLGWARFPARLASRSKRRVSSGVCGYPILTATRRPTRLSSARHTSPKPPLPSNSSSAYRSSITSRTLPAPVTA